MTTNPNMVAIQTVTVGAGGAATIDFTNIPQTYTDLQLVVSSRATQTDTPVKVEFNNVTTGYSWRRIFGSGSAASSLSGTDAFYFWTATSSQTASTFGSGQLYIPNYTSSNNKSISTESLNENNGTAADMFITAALWSNSAAITSIKLTPLTGSFAQYSTATLYGVTSAGYGAKATGGIVTSDANYWYHTFTSTASFTPTQSLTADILVIAGGGGANGGSSYAGGGAGGLLSFSAQSLTVQNYTVTVGAGGAGIGNGATTATSGSNSSFQGLTAAIGGGGGGGGWTGSGNGPDGLSGGSGGGGGGSYTVGGATTTRSGGAGTSGQGFAGGNGSPVTGTVTQLAGGGGGGASAVGSAGTSGGVGGNGGAGSTTYSTWATATGTGVGGAYAGGGAAFGQSGVGTAGIGNGGLSASSAPIAPTANTGSGGNGANAVAGTAGASGIVIVRYAK